MDFRDVVTIDFETLPVTGRPEYPPLPVGVAIKVGDGPGRYLAWGHPEGNNSTLAEARAELSRLVGSGLVPILMHNAKFDADVLETHMGVPVPWAMVHDTMPLLFLRDPHAASYALKPSAELLLGEAPSERDEMIEWLIEHQPVAGKRLGRAKGKNYAGAYACLCPVDLAGPYAIGDVDRTYEIFRRVYPEIEAAGMLPAYQREMQLMPILLDMERGGLRVDLPRIESGIARFRDAIARVDAWLHDRLGAEINLNAPQQLAAALIAAGVVDERHLPRTDKSGDLSGRLDDLESASGDPQLIGMIKWSRRAKKALDTWLEPWAETARRSGGRIYTEWHSTRREGGGFKSYGARTGRLSSSPNFQNIPKTYPAIFPEGIEPPFEIPALPLVRDYVLPEDGHALIDRDYSQQELRVLGHFERGAVADAYRKEPWLDLHTFAKDTINAQTGMGIERGAAKQIGLGLVYGMGVTKLAEQIGTTIDKARAIKEAYLRAFPGIKQIYDICAHRARTGKPIKTWGARLYHVEPVKRMDDGRVISFEYKLPNTLIQGSSADITKQAVIDFAARKRPEWRITLLIHDEIVVSVPAGEVDEAMRVLRECMDSVPLSVPLLSEGKAGATLQQLAPYDKRGGRVK